MKKAGSLFVIVIFILSCSGNNISEDLPLLSVNSILPVQETNQNFELLIEFNLDKPSRERIGFEFSTIDNSAVANNDFVPIQKKLITIEKGDLSVAVPVTIVADYEFEETESFFIELSNPLGIEIDNNLLEVIILNDDEYFDPELVIPTTGYTSPEQYVGWTSIWSDEFEEAELNSNYWNLDIGRGSSGWGNNEWEYYTDKNHSLVEGNLVLEARQEYFQGSQFTSTRIKTQNKFDFTYGRVDVRAVLPFGQGIWPAIWMLGSSISEVGWPKCGEIDIMEMIGGQDREDTVHGTVHWANSSELHAFTGGQYVLSSESSFQDEFHVYSIIWDTDKIQWFVDDQKYYEKSISSAEFSEFSLPHFLLINLAVGGNWPGYPDESTKFPQRLIVDYVRIFQKVQ